ncbi:MAG: MFS transporter [Lachnospiraceae bacterium]
MKTAKRERKKPPVGFGKLFAWGSRSASTGIATMILGYLTIYATNTMQMSPVLVGTLLLVSKLLDGVTDLFAGYIVDRTNTRWGKGRPYEWCVVGMWISTWLLFSTPASFSVVMKSVWILCMYGLANSVFYTFLNANGTVYMVRAFDNQEAYVALSTYGGLIPIIFVFAFNVVFPTLMGSIATSPAGWSRLVLLFAVPLTVLGMMRFFVVRETHDVDVERKEEKLVLRDVFQMLKKDPYIFIIAIINLVFNLITNMGVGVYYFTDIVGNVGLMGVTALAQVVTLPMMFILPAILKKTSVIRVMQGGVLVLIAGYIVNFFAGSNMMLLMLGSILTGGGSVPLSMLVGLLIIDCADYNEYVGMKRLEGSLSALNGFATKVGSGLGSAVMGILIGIAGYDGSLAVQPASAVSMIRLLYSLIPAVMYVGVLILLHFFKLEKQMPMVRKANEENRKKSAEKQEQ